MLRIVTGAGSALALVLAGFFIWKSKAAADEAVPTAPRSAAAVAVSGFGQQPSGSFAGRFRPPEASERSKEEKRFARADKNKDGRIVLAELLEPRHKAFAKLDADGSGQLSFEEWTGKTGDKFSEADADHSGFLTPAEYATTKPKTKAKPPRCAC